MTSEVQTKVGRSDAPARPMTTLDPIGFWSYARADDAAAGNALTNLRLVLKRELEQQLGRDIELFQDVKAIPKGAEWARKIRHAIAQSTFFIPIVTPRFIQSGECAKEMQMFIDRQQAIFDTYPDLPRESRIFPILYIAIDEIEPFDRESLAEISKRQYFDFTQLRLEDVGSKAVRVAVADFARDLCRVLRARVAVPLSVEEREAQRQEAEAAAKAEHEAQEQRARAAEAAEKARLAAAAEAREQARVAAEAAAKVAEEEVRRAELAAEVTAHDNRVATLATLRTRLDTGLAHSRTQAELRETRAAADAEEKRQRDLARAAGRERNRRLLRRALIIASWVIGTPVALFALAVIFAMVNGPTPSSTTANESAAENSADVSPPPAAPDYSWTTKTKWGVDGDCRNNWLKVAIRGDDLMLTTPAGEHAYKIKAKSTSDNLMASGAGGDVTMSHSPSRTSVTYPETGEQELTPCK